MNQLKVFILYNLYSQVQYGWKQLKINVASDKFWVLKGKLEFW